MEGYSSQIAERIRMLQEQNNARSEEQDAADRAMAEGKNVSEPVVEQVKPDPKKKKKKKKVSVQRSDIAKALESASSEPVIRPQEMPAPEPSPAPKAEIPAEPEISPQRDFAPQQEESRIEPENPREKGSRAALDASLGAMEDLFGKTERRPQKKGTTSTVSISGKEAERIRAEIREELRREMEAEAAKTGENMDPNPRHRGPHAVIQKKIKYVDTSGTPLREFCLIDASTGEVKQLKDSMLIGKSESCDLVIPNRYVSRRHAKISCRAGAYYIEDLGSTNGTTINGHRLYREDGEKQIEPGDKIEFAACSFIFDAIG